jgi:hemerythrin superfamily protein
MARAAKRSSSRSKTAQSRSGARGGSKSRSGGRGAASKSRSTARATARGATRRRSASSSAARRTGNAGNDATALLKADHRSVEELFDSFESARGDDRKQDLATRICNALRVHSQIEEEIFYPAYLEATQDADMHHEAIIEHDGVKKLISEIESSGPGDDYFDARVSVLSEMVKHHVREEEQRDGLFTKARSAGMDLRALGEQMAERKAQLEAEPDLLKTAKQMKEAGKGLMSRVLTKV